MGTTLSLSTLQSTPGHHNQPPCTSSLLHSSSSALPALTLSATADSVLEVWATAWATALAPWEATVPPSSLTIEDITSSHELRNRTRRIWRIRRIRRIRRILLISKVDHHADLKPSQFVKSSVL